jgi:zinc protease
VLVVGDVRPEEVIAAAREHYGDWKRGTWRSVVPREPRQIAARDLVVDWPEPTQPYLYGGYRAPAFSVTDKSQATLDLVGQLLFSEAAPLYQRLVVEEQKVDFLIGGADDHRDPYLFTFQARVKKESELPSVLLAVTEALEGMSRALVPAARLQEAKSHIRYAFAMSLDTPSRVARHLAHYLALTGETETVNRLFAMYDRITPEDVREIAASCFVPSGRTVARLRQRTTS